jgi:hypothetical protein
MSIFQPSRGVTTISDVNTATKQVLPDTASLGYINVSLPQGNYNAIVFIGSNGQANVKDQTGNLLVQGGVITSYGASVGAGTVGSTTTTAGIQESLNYVQSQGGGMVIVKAGTYTFTSVKSTTVQGNTEYYCVVIPSNSLLWIQKGATVTVANGLFNASSPQTMFINNAAVSGATGVTGTGQFDTNIALIIDGIIDGNGANQTGGGVGFDFYMIEGLYFECKGLIQNTFAQALQTDTCRKSVFGVVRVKNCGVYGNLDVITFRDDYLCKGGIFEVEGGNKVSLLIKYQEQFWTLSSVTSVATTLSASASKGTTSVTVTSATGLAVGAGVAIGNVATGSPVQNTVEYNIISSISGTTIGLTNPLSFNHASGENFSWNYITLTSAVSANANVNIGTWLVFTGQDSTTGNELSVELERKQILAFDSTRTKISIDSAPSDTHPANEAITPCTWGNSYISIHAYNKPANQVVLFEGMTMDNAIESIIGDFQRGHQNDGMRICGVANRFGKIFIRNAGTVSGNGGAGISIIANGAPTRIGIPKFNVFEDVILEDIGQQGILINCGHHNLFKNVVVKRCGLLGSGQTAFAPNKQTPISSTLYASYNIVDNLTVIDDNSTPTINNFFAEVNGGLNDGNQIVHLKVQGLASASYPWTANVVGAHSGVVTAEGISKSFAGSVGGTATAYQEKWINQGQKIVTVIFSSYNDAGSTSITFPFAFLATPTIVGNSTGVSPTVSTTGLTFNSGGSAKSGSILLMGV